MTAILRRAARPAASLRARLLLVAVALVAAGLLASDVATYTAVSSFLTQRVDRQLRAVATSPLLARYLAVGGPPPFAGPRGNTERLLAGASTGLYLQVRGGAGDVLGAYDSRDSSSGGGQSQPGPALPATLPVAADPGLAAQPGGLSVAASQPFTVATAGGAGPLWRAIAVTSPVSGVSAVVAVPLTDVSATMGRLSAIEILVTAIALLVVGLGALWLVRLSLRPLDAIAATAGAIAAGDLSRRIEGADPGTEVGRLGLALNAMLTQIEAAFLARQASEGRLRRFIADASHELRTPLTSIRGYSELFRRGADLHPDDLAKTMRRIEEEAARMGLLVDDLLLLARLDQGRPLEREPVDLADLARAAVDAAQAVEPDRPLTLETPEHLLVSGDAHRLRQVLDNLLANVRTHTPPGTAAELRLSSDGTRAVIELQDHGPGLPPEDAARVFERFYRADPSRSRQHGGAGLGLSIVAAIAEAHGGAASLRSTPEDGATFRVELPT